MGMAVTVAMLVGMAMIVLMAMFVRVGMTGNETRRLGILKHLGPRLVVMIDHDRLNGSFGEAGVVGVFVFAVVNMAVRVIVRVLVIIVMMMVPPLDVNLIRTASAYLAHDLILPPGL